jgi:transposase
MVPLPPLSDLSPSQKDDLILSLAAEITRLKGIIAALEARLNKPEKTPDNSSVPPSQGKKDNKPEQEKRKDRRKGSIGRQGHHRPLSENPDETVKIMPTVCSCCQCKLEASAVGEDQEPYHVYDKIDIPDVKPHVTRVELYEQTCACCGQANKPGVVPEGLEPGTPFGANIMALAIYLRFLQNISYQRLARVFGDLFGLSISEGALDSILKRAKPAFDAETEAILKRLRQSRVIYSDETSIRVQGKTCWNWVFHNKECVLHVIRNSRGRGIVEEVLGGHRPALWVSDLYGPQQGHAQEWQICLAHQLRDCQYAIDAGDTVFAPRMKRIFLRAFVIAKRRHKLADSTRKTYKARLEREISAAIAAPVEHKDGIRLRKRYGKHRGSLLTFMDHPELDPDNNSSERELRPTATYRKVTGGFRSTWAPDLCAGVKSAVATAVKSGKNAFQAIKKVLGFRDKPAMA